MGHSFTWKAAGSGAWNTPANWFDATTTAEATIAPGAADVAEIDGPGTGVIAVSGPASVHDLTVNGTVTLAGDLTIGAFVVATLQGNIPEGGTTTSNIALTGNVVANSVTIGSQFLVPGLSSLSINEGLVEIGAGAGLSAGTVALNAGALRMDGGILDIDGIVTLGSLLFSPRAPLTRLATGTLDVGNRASVHLGGLAITGGSVSLDATSILEIGNAGTATAGTITIDPGAGLAIGDFFTPSDTVTISGPVLNNGSVDDNGFTDLSDIINTGTITVRAATLTSIDGPGQIVVGDGVTIGPSVHGTVDCVFSSTTLAIALGSGIAIDTLDTPPIAGFAPGDAIVLQGVVADAAHYAPTGTGIGTLTLDSGGAAIASLTLLGNYQNADFAVAGNTDGSAISVNVTCFAAGTQISTSRGDVRVERLRVGDTVATRIGGAFRTIRWLGFRTVDIARHPHWTDWAPVRIARDAFGAGLPRRALYLSPDHAVFADGVLVPIKYLVNGETVEQMRRPSITYWHIELDTHDVVLAEGLPTESYLDTGDRSRFANGGVVAQLHPSFSALAWEAHGCAPLVVTGPIVAKLRRRLRRRAVALRDRKRKLAA